MKSVMKMDDEIENDDDDDEQLGEDMKISRRVLARNQLAIFPNFASDISAVQGVLMMMTMMKMMKMMMMEMAMRIILRVIIYHKYNIPMILNAMLLKEVGKEF